MTALSIPDMRAGKAVAIGLVAVLVIAIICLPFAAARAAAELAPVEVFPEQSIGSVRDNVVYATDVPLNPLTAFPDEIVPHLRAMEHASTQFGQVRQSVIAVLPVINAGDSTGNWILDTGRGSLTTFRLYVDRGDGLQLLIDNSDVEQVEEILFQYQAFATEFSLAPGEEVRFVIQFYDTASSYMPLEITTSTAFFEDRRVNIALVSAVVAGSIILIFVNVLMFGVTGKRAFAWLGAAEVAFMLNTLHAEGYTTIFLLYDAPQWQAYLGDMLRVSFSALMAQFGRVFLETGDRFARLDIALRAAVWSGWVIFAVALAGVAITAMPGGPVHLAGWLHTACVAVILPVLAWLAIRDGGWIYWPLLVSWASVGAFIVYMAIGVSGIAPQLPLPWHMVGPIGLFECMMATLALGLHLRQLHFERLASEAKAKDALLEKLAVSNEATRLAEERAGALAALQGRDRLIEASGHDTRHVLHALNSAIHFTRTRGEESLPHKDLAGLIEASARHLDEIVATTIGVGSKSAPFMTLGLVSPARIFEDIEAIYSVPAFDARMRISWNADPDCQVITDEALVARAVSNLVNNAVKFGGSGEVELSCALSDQGLALCVSDNGKGMPEEVLAELRGPVRDSEESALGTGWRAIRDVMALLCGDYSIESGPAGTSVTLRIPDPLGGAQPSIAEVGELRRLAPGLAFFDDAAMSQQELEIALDDLGPDAIAVLVTLDASSDRRMWATKNFALLLTRPLCRQVLDHPHLQRLYNKPADLARATS